MTVRALACALTTTGLALAAAAPASAVDYGSRTMREGTSGSDVTQLQRYLNRAGFPTTADGAFGPRTARSVRSFESEHDRRVNGVVPPSDATAIKRVATARDEAETEQVEPEETDRARITSRGLAVAPSSAPSEVKQVIAAGNEIAKKPYKYGGGHGSWRDSGYDCSGSVSYALHGAGLLSRPRSSGEFSSWGRSGRGRWITVYGHGGHAYMVVAGLRFDTSGLDEDGSRWHRTKRPTDGYDVRHPRGL